MAKHNTLFRSIVASMMLLFTSLSAQATIIKQDVFLDSDNFGVFRIASIELSFDETLLNTGLLDTDQAGLSLLLLSIFDDPNVEFFDFFAVIDTDNLFAGIEYLVFDVQETAYFDNWNYNLIFDAFDPDTNLMDIFDSFGDLVTFGTVFLSQAEIVRDVPAPGPVALLALAGLVVAARRRAQQK